MTVIGTIEPFWGSLRAADWLMLVLICKKSDKVTGIVSTSTNSISILFETTKVAYRV